GAQGLSAALAGPRAGRHRLAPHATPGLGSLVFRALGRRALWWWSNNPLRHALARGHRGGARWIWRPVDVGPLHAPGPASPRPFDGAAGKPVSFALPGVRHVLVLATMACVSPPWLAAQREVGVLYGGWAAGRTESYEARLDRPWGSLIRHGVALQVTNERGAAGTTFYGVGYELEVLRGMYTLGPYAAMSGALGAESDTGGQRIAALWTAGLGLE